MSSLTYYSIAVILQSMISGIFRLLLYSEVAYTGQVILSSFSHIHYQSGNNNLMYFFKVLFALVTSK